MLTWRELPHLHQLASMLPGHSSSSLFLSFFLSLSLSVPSFLRSFSSLLFSSFLFVFFFPSLTQLANTIDITSGKPMPSASATHVVGDVQHVGLLFGLFPNNSLKGTHLRGTAILFLGFFPICSALFHMSLPCFPFLSVFFLVSGTASLLVWGFEEAIPPPVRSKPPTRRAPARSR